MSAQIRDLIAEGRRLYAAALDSGEHRVVLSSEGDTAPTTDLLVWAGNNLPVLLDALDEAEAASARTAALEAVIDRARTALSGHPRCEVHPADDLVSCGWKRAVADVQRALVTDIEETE